MTQGGYSNGPEGIVLQDEIQGEKKLLEQLRELKLKKELLVSTLRQKYPHGKYFEGKLEDPQASPGYRRLEIRIENDGTASLLVSFGDPNKAHSDFEESISFSIHEKENESLINIHLSKKGQSKQDRGLTFHLKSDGTSYTNSTLGSRISGEHLASASRRISLFLDQFTDTSTLSEFKAETKLPPQFGLPSAGEDHPEAPWN